MDPQLQSYMQQQQQQIAQLQQEVQQLRMLSASAGASSSASMRHSDDSDVHFGLNRLMNKPSLFHGEFGSVSVYDWVIEMDALFRNCSSSMPEQRKVTFAVAQLREEALRWWDRREREVQRNEHDGPQALHSWEEFKAALIEYFQPRAKSEAARSALKKLRQWNFRGMQEYIRAFEATAQQIEVPPGQSINEELVSDFKDGLTDGQVRLAITSNHPKTLLQATQVALQAESDLRVSGMHAARGRGLAPYRGSYRQFDRYSGARASSSGTWPRHGSTSASPAWSQPQEHRSSGTVPMELSSLAAARPEESDDEQRSDGSIEALERAQRSGSEEASDREDHFARPDPSDCEATCDNCGCNTITMRPKGSSGPPVCWNCGQVGHVKRNCTAPERRSHVGPLRPNPKLDGAKGSGSSRGGRPNFH